MTGQPLINGTTLGSRVPIFENWRTLPLTAPQPEAGTAPAPEPPAATEHPEPAFDPIALAEADRIRRRAEAEAEALRIEAEGRAEAEKIKAEEEARRARLANDKAERRAREEDAASQARIAELDRKRDEADRAREEAARQAAEQQQTEAGRQEKLAKSAGSWRQSALGFAIVCAIVALPVQMNAFYSPSAPWLLAAPLVLEGGAWVVLKGAAAAVDDHRPHWHYRLIAWGAAFLAAGINLWHGLGHFGVATAIGTAFASIAGPGVWDLHEHGRIRTRDGKLTRRQRRAKRAQDKRAATQKAAEQKRAEAEKKAAEEAARQAAEQLSVEREKIYPKEWEHALALRVNLGQITVTEDVWRRAWYDLHGTEPGDSVDTIRTRRTAETRVATARGEEPANTARKATSAQRAIQTKTPRRKSSYKPVPPRRTPGDTPAYHPVAGQEHGAVMRRSNAAKNATEKDA